MDMVHHLVTWVADGFRVQSFPNAGGLKLAVGRVPEGQRRVEVKGLGDLGDLSNSELVALRNHLSPGKPIKIFQSKAKGMANVWSLLTTRKEPEDSGAKESVSTPEHVSATTAEVSATANTEMEDDMAKAKKKAKRAPKANGSGEPRGEKMKKIAQMLKRASGCTRADILEATGWKAVSVQQMAKALGLKLKKEKEKGEVSRYFGSE